MTLGVSFIAAGVVLLAQVPAQAQAQSSAPAGNAGADEAAKEVTAPHSTEGGAGSAEELAAVKKELAELKRRLDVPPSDVATPADVSGVQSDLENFKYQYQRERETKTALSTRNLLITGIVQTRFQYTSTDITTPVPPDVANTSVNNPPLIHGRNSTFDVPAAILSFSGLLYRDYEKARNLGFSVSFAASPATSNAGMGASNINAFLSVLDANVAYQLLPTIENDGDRLSLTLGQQLVPFGLEANTTEELKPVINNALFVGASGLNLRQIGLIARGELFSQYDFGYNYRQSLVQIAAGVINGNGPNRDDENNAKDLVGRVALTVPAEYNSWLRELRVGASAYRGRTVLTDAQGAYLSGGRKNRWGVDVYYNHFPLGVTYEYVRLEDETASSGQVASLSREAHTATFFYSIGEQFLRSIKTQGKFNDWWPKTYQPFVRYDRLDPNRAVARNAIVIYTAGLNVFFAETTKAQLNVNRRVQENADGETASSEVLAQIQFGF